MGSQRSDLLIPRTPYTPWREAQRKGQNKGFTHLRQGPLLPESQVYPGESHTSICKGSRKFGLWGSTGWEMYSSSVFILAVHFNPVKRNKNIHILGPVIENLL